MSMSLRDRRRRDTAREIQQAALRVAQRMGYAAATTDAIAAEANISPRTFFNYYVNKQAAILGLPPVLDVVAGQWIVASDGPLIDDILRLLGQMLRDDDLNRETLRLIIEVVDKTPDLQIMFRKTMDEITQALAGLLAARLGSGRASQAGLVAGTATHALSNAVQAWAENDAMTEADILADTRDQLVSVGQILCSGGVAAPSSGGAGPT